MRIALTLATLIFIISCTSEEDEKEAFNYNTFVNQFPNKKKPIEIDSSVLLNNPNNRNWSVLLKGESYLSSDSILKFAYKSPRHHDSLKVLFKPLGTFARTKYYDSLDAFIVSFRPSLPNYSEAFRLELFYREKLINAFNIASSNFISHSEEESLFVVTSNLLDNQIRQYKVAIKNHEKVNLFGRVGGENYYFTFGDT